MTDVEISDQGTVITFTPLTTRARFWFNENVEFESWQWLRGTLAVDHRPAQGLIDGLSEGGFRIRFQ